MATFLCIDNRLINTDDIAEIGGGDDTLKYTLRNGRSFESDWWSFHHLADALKEKHAVPAAPGFATLTAWRYEGTVHFIRYDVVAWMVVADSEEAIPIATGCYKDGDFWCVVEPDGDCVGGNLHHNQRKDAAAWRAAASKILMERFELRAMAGEPACVEETR